MLVFDTKYDTFFKNSEFYEDKFLKIKKDSGEYIKYDDSLTNKLQQVSDSNQATIFFYKDFKLYPLVKFIDKYIYIYDKSSDLNKKYIDFDLLNYNVNTFNGGFKNNSILVNKDFLKGGAVVAVGPGICSPETIPFLSQDSFKRSGEFSDAIDYMTTIAAKGQQARDVISQFITAANNNFSGRLRINGDINLSWMDNWKKRIDEIVYVYLLDHYWHYTYLVAAYINFRETDVGNTSYSELKPVLKQYKDKIQQLKILYNNQGTINNKNVEYFKIAFKEGTQPNLSISQIVTVNPNHISDNATQYAKNLIIQSYNTYVRDIFYSSAGIVKTIDDYVSSFDTRQHNLDKIICAEQWFNNEEQRIIDGEVCNKGSSRKGQ